MPSFLNRLRWTSGLAIWAMLASVAFFGSNFVVSRYGALHGFKAADLAALRFLVTAPFVLPLFLRRGLSTCAGLGWRRGLLLACTSGAPMTLLMNTGVSLAPASHGAALGPGMVTMVGVLHGIIVAGALPPRLTRLGLGLVVTGLVSIALAGTVTGSRDVMLGDFCFFLTGVLWGFYPILLQRWRVDPITGAAICIVLSLPWSLGYVLLGDTNLLRVPGDALLFQAVFQGVNLLGGLWLWGNAVRVLGAAKTALYPPMIPVVGTLVAIPVLGEMPGPVQAVGVLLIVGGLLTATYGIRRAIREAAGRGV